jgi:hypothetical protein
VSEHISQQGTALGLKYEQLLVEQCPSVIAKNVDCSYKVYLAGPPTILIMKANEMHYFSYLFEKVLYMFRTSPLSIIRSI